MGSGSLAGLLIVVILFSVTLSGCLAETLDAEDEDSLAEPFTRVNGFSMGTSESHGCDLASSQLSDPCLEYDMQILDGITCEPPQLFLEALRGEITGEEEREIRKTELRLETRLSPGDPYLSCEYKVPWSVTANFVYPGSSLEVTASHDQGDETRTCDAAATESCTVEGVMEGIFTIEGPDESIQLPFMFKGAVAHDLGPAETGDFDHHTEITLYT